MEHSLCRQRQKYHSPLSSSSTADSLDLRQLLASDRIQPLIAESLTFGTLSSSSSDQVPPFSSYKPPKLSIIGLGDHLKMFSGPLSQLQEPRTDVKPKIVITSPTSPRLKSMFKECLCISKWAVGLFFCDITTAVNNSFSRLKECLTGWRAPGHIPWGNLPDRTTDDEKWLPEGSLYSPEDFSRALYQARAGYMRANVAQTEQESCAIVDSSLDKHTIATERMDFSSSSGTLTHVELVDMMRELKDLKNFFEGTPQEVSRIVHPGQVILPSLMISNSHCTFPLSLDSCQSFTLKPAANLADRRGRKPPPPLLLKNETSSGLLIEDMINNLRFQCSSMALKTPPVDSSWNSRSCSVAYEPVKKSTETQAVEFAESIPNSHQIGTATKGLQTAKDARTDTSDKKPEVLSKYSSPPLLLRSSLAKHPTFQSRSLKSVRFALSPLEFEKDVASLMYDDDGHSSQVSAQDYLYDKSTVKQSSTPQLSPAFDKEGLEKRTPRHSTSATLVDMDKDDDRPQRSLESRGRHSLSRIIKGPIFSGKEHKRATVSNAFSARWGKGTATRDNVASESIRRKSRMPVPLRNILTHFK